MAVVDFTTFTETDPTGAVTVTSTKIDCSNLDMTSLHNVYKSYGVDYFDALDVDVEMYLSSSSQTNNTDIGFAFINSATPASEARGTIGATDVHGMIYRYNSSYRTYLMSNGGATSDSYNSLSANTLYYFTMSRSAGSNTVNMYVYSDSGRTSLIDTLTITGFGTVKWQYCYGLMHNNFNEANNNVYGYIQNMDLNIASGVANLKSYNGNVKANIKSINGNPIANVKSLNTNV